MWGGEWGVEVCVVCSVVCRVLHSVSFVCSVLCPLFQSCSKLLTTNNSRSRSRKMTSVERAADARLLSYSAQATRLIYRASVCRSIHAKCISDLSLCINCRRILRPTATIAIIANWCFNTYMSGNIYLNNFAGYIYLTIYLF